MEIQNILLFLSIAFIATITPGPAILLATSHSLTYGLKSSVFTILGNITGLFIMSVLSVAGLSAIILGSALLFSIVKFAGAIYLIYLGFKLWRNGFPSVKGTEPSEYKKASHRKLYASGLAVALSNPKAIAFTTALFPQFIAHEEPILIQFSILVSTFMLLSFLCIFGYAYAIHTTQRKYMESPHNYLSKVLGAGFIASGIALASAMHHK
ncbi:MULTISPECIES: LysE family translocator [unclassified Halomonas]|uniref:LysE family translocator n=1 Tax=unclassified Halomonas TaxID=2609666 RepID=UPI0009907418|nr:MULTISPECIES: LysE family translocator [unclassified Halomonas]AQU82649.1 lysine transporter LysE [Halomonas sp. 'Soap Lake \